MTSRISVLGTGRMGSALAGAFLKQGYETHIWNRTTSKYAPLVALGARPAATVLDAVTATDTIVVNVNDYETSDRLLRSDDVTKALRGKLVVQLTSGSPRQAREAAAWARQHDIQYLDGAIMATPDFIGQAAGTLLYSGSIELFERHKPVLLALGGNTLHVGGDVGHASALDSALLVFMWGQLFGVLQGAAIAEAENIPLDAYAGHLKAVASVVDGAAADVLKRIQERRFDSETTLATIDSHHGALRHLLELCRERGIHHGVPDAFDRLFDKAVSAGRGQEDFAALSTFMR